MTADVEGAGTAAEHLELTRGVGLDPYRRGVLVHVAQVRTQNQLRHRTHDDRPSSRTDPVRNW